MAVDMTNVALHPGHDRPYDFAKHNWLEDDEPCPAGVVRLGCAKKSSERLMPDKSPELAILTALFIAEPRLARKIESTLYALRNGERGEEGQMAFNYVNRLVMGAN